MATIDLIVLGMLKTSALSAYDIQKLVEYRNISKWVKISTPSIYKKVLQLEEKGLIKGTTIKEGKMPEKAIYTLTVLIVNINNLSPDKQKKCLSDIKNNIEILKAYLEDNINSKEQKPEIPTAGMAVLQQQLILVQAIENWIATLPNVF